MKTEKCSFVSWSACWAHVRNKTKTLCREWIPKNCSALHLTADHRLVFYIVVQKINTDLLSRIWMNSVVQKKKRERERGIVSFRLCLKKGRKGTRVMSRWGGRCVVQWKKEVHQKTQISLITFSVSCWWKVRWLLWPAKHSWSFTAKQCCSVLLNDWGRWGLDLGLRWWNQETFP